MTRPKKRVTLQILVAPDRMFLLCSNHEHLTTPLFTALSDRLAVILTGLCHAIAACGGRRMLGWDRRPPDPAIVPLIVPIWGRVSRLRQRFAALVARVLAGRLPRAPQVGRVRAARVPTAVRLPAAYGWLVRLLPDAAGFGGQVQALLDDPAIGPLLVAAPGAGRVLRPLCRMLAVPLPVALGGTGEAPKMRPRKAPPVAAPATWAELIASKPALPARQPAFTRILRKSI